MLPFAGLSVFVTVETMVDGKPRVLKRTTTARKSVDKSDVLVWQSMSFHIPQPLWDTVRNHTILTLSFHRQKRFVTRYKSNLGQVELGLHVADPSSAEHWNMVTKFPRKMFSRWHNLRASED